MEPVDNNQFEVKPINSKRKIEIPCPNAYLNPALDLLANEDPMCNTAMEIPVKKRKRTRSCEIVAFENSALDIGITKEAVNEFLKKELDNVRKNIKLYASADVIGSPKVHSGSKDESGFENMPGYAKKGCDELSLPVVENYPAYDIVGLPTVDPGTSTSHENAVQQFLNFEKAITSQDQTWKPEAKVLAVVEPRMNVSEPIYANLSDLSALQTNPDKEIVTTSHLPVSRAANFTVTVDTENGLEISNIEDINLTGIDSKMATFEPKNYTLAIPEFGKDIDISAINKTVNMQTNVTNQVFINNNSSINLSFIEKLALDSPSLTSQSLCLDDDLNESNIMEIKTITIITKKKLIPEKKKITNPFLDPTLTESLQDESQNPFLNTEEEIKPEPEYNDEVMNQPAETRMPQAIPLMPRRLFADGNSTVSTMNESNSGQNEYENIDGYRSESPVYENVGEELLRPNFEKQSRILGCDVSHFNALDIMNINRNKINSSDESNDSKKDFKHQILKASNKLSRKVFKTLRKTFKHDKSDTSTSFNVTSNPYEVPRKMPKRKAPKNDSGIENPALKLDISDETDEEDDPEHQYESIKTLRNTRLNMNVTPLRERQEENVDTSHNKTNTPSKKVRFDSTLNQQKFITGNSFDNGIQSPGFDAKIDKYHDELENCINEKKFLQQNM